jgi:hypothetical protein
MVITWALDLSQSPQSKQRKIKKLCDLCGLCEITRKCIQLSKFLMAEIRTNPDFYNTGPVEVVANASPFAKESIFEYKERDLSKIVQLPMIKLWI